MAAPRQGLSPAAIIGIIGGVLVAMFVGTCALGMAIGLSEHDDLPDVAVEPNEGGDRWAVLPSTPPPGTARPVAYSDAAGPRLLIFGASWCPACEGAVLSDAAIVERFSGKVDVGVALAQSDEEFLDSSMSRWLGETPVWSQQSTREIYEHCGVMFLPAACLVEGDTVLWSGEAQNAAAILDAYVAHGTDEPLDRTRSLPNDVDMSSGEARDRVRAALAGYAGTENTLAWDIADDSAASAEELGLAVDLARDASNTTQGLDYAILDTYALALSRAGHTDEAATVAKRVLDLCDLLGASCHEERARAEAFVAIATD
jgi:hypothetical protein